MIFVISGPSGSGKSTLIQKALENLKGLRFSVSHTTREKRKAEVEGKDYYFVSDQKFLRMVEKKEFVEWAIVHGDYYGTSKRELQAQARRGDVVLDIDVQGAMQVKTRIKKAVFIFILPPRFQELKRRLERRKLDRATVIQKRLARARKEIRYYSRFDYIVINDRLEKAVEELVAILRSHRCSLEARKPALRPILESFRRGDRSPG